MKYLVLGFVLVASQAQAAIYNYDMYLPSHIQNYLQKINSDSPSEGQRSCEGNYTAIHEKGVYDIRYALGYFDDTTGVERVEQGVNYGKSPSLDIAVFDALRAALTERCYTRGLRSCGFKESGDPKSGRVELRKYQKIQGKEVLVRLTLTQASASESYQKNKTTLAERQKMLTLQSEENYFGGLKEADVVLYNGHSRDGGGPDFNPPVLNSKDKTNYSGYYHVKQPGFKRLLASLKENPNKNVVVGLFSCYSRRHFYNDMVRLNPNQKMVLSSDTIDYMDTLLGSLGYLEGLLRGTCGKELSDTAKKTEKVRAGFLDYKM